MDQLEEILTTMSKPGVKELKHQELLGKAIVQSKRKTVLSTWWLAIPLYCLAMLGMETIYKKGTSLHDHLHQMDSSNPHLAQILFAVVPLALILLNGLHIWSTWKITRSLNAVLLNATMIIISLLVLIFYLCN